jgi:hypothetical protein
VAKRFVEGEALWTSLKIKNVPVEYRAEYAWLLPYAEINGCFEYRPDLIHRAAYSINRPDVSHEKLEGILQAFVDAGMLHVYETDGKTWATFVGIEKFLPPQSDIAKYKNLPPRPAVEKQELAGEDDQPRELYVKSPEKYIENACRGFFDDVDITAQRSHLRKAVQAHGSAEIREAFDFWLQSLQEVDVAIALASDNEVVFGSNQKPLLAVLVRDYGAAEVIATFKEFWGKLDDFGKKFATPGFLDKAPILLLARKTKQEQKARQEEAQERVRAVLTAKGQKAQAEADDLLAEDAKVLASFASEGFEI